MKPIVSLRLNLWLPALFTVVFIVLWVILILHHYQGGIDSLVRSNKYFLTQDLSLLKRDLDEQITPNSQTKRKHELQARVTNVYYQTLITTDDKGTILNSHKRGLVGKILYDEFSYIQPNVIEHLKQTQTASIEFIPEQMLLVAYYPITLPRTINEIRSLREGILFAEYTLKDEQKLLWQQAVRSGLFMAVYLFIALLLSVSFVYYFVTRPIHRLSKIVQFIVEQTVETPDFEVSGNGELAKLGRNIKKMAYSLAERFTELEQSQTALKEQQNMLEEMVERRTFELTIANEELQEKERYLAEAQQITHLGSWSIDKRNNHILWSREMYQILGMDPQSANLSELTFVRVVHPDDRRFILETFRNSVIELSSFEIEHRIVTCDGIIKHVSTRGLTRWNFVQGKRVLVTQGTMLDITRRKLNELELIKAKEAAESADKEKSRSLANMSHELRTPMHGILSFARFGIDKSLQAERTKLKKYFTHIHTSGQRLLTLLNDLLDLSKLDSENLYLDISRTDLVSLFDTCRLEQEARLEELDLKVKVIQPSYPVNGNMDAARIGQVMTNMLSNAIKFSPPQSTITVTLEINSDEELCFSICDQGIGIPEDELESIFDAFIQSTKTRTGAGGTGLGLSIVMRIIQAHGGRVWAENNPSGGAIFKFVLPGAVENSNLSGL